MIFSGRQLVEIAENWEDFLASIKSKFLSHLINSRKFYSMKGKVYNIVNSWWNRQEYYWLFSPASLFLASATSAIPGSASFQRPRNIS